MIPIEDGGDPWDESNLASLCQIGERIAQVQAIDVAEEVA